MTEAQLAQIITEITLVGRLVLVVLAIQVLTGIALVLAHRKIAKNEVALADLLRQAVARIESDLPAARK